LVDVDPGFPPPLNFYEASRFVLPIGRMPLTDITDKETNERTDGRTDWRTVRPSVSYMEFDTYDARSRYAATMLLSYKMTMR